VDPADVRLLEDLVLAAASDALGRLKDRLREEMTQATGIAGLPPGLFGA
jgi:DNA-binding protein YbaB